MQLGWENHLRRIVIPAWQAYLAAEKSLTDLAKTKDEDAIERASYDALREGGAASLYVHHFIEIVAIEIPPFLPIEIGAIRNESTRLGLARAWLAEACYRMRSATLCTDVELLRQVADALKHSALTRQNLEVEARDAVLTTARGYGTGGYGEGKYGGGPEVWVLAKSGKRSLSSVLQNVIDAWRRRLGWELPEIGLP